MRVRLMLLAGVVLLAGVGSAVFAEAATDCGAEYTVKPGDSMGRIAKRCGVDAAALMKANTHIPNASQISVGDRLSIPGTRAARAETSPQGGPMELTGRIVNGRWCAQLETEDGQRWGVVSPKVSFRSNMVVKVSGVVTTNERCTPGKTLIVSDLTPVN